MTCSSNFFGVPEVVQTSASRKSVDNLILSCLFSQPHHDWWKASNFFALLVIPNVHIETAWVTSVPAKNGGFTCRPLRFTPCNDSRTPWIPFFPTPGSLCKGIILNPCCAVQIRCQNTAEFPPTGLFYIPSNSRKNLGAKLLGYIFLGRNFFDSLGPTSLLWFHSDSLTLQCLRRPTFQRQHSFGPATFIQNTNTLQLL